MNKKNAPQVNAAEQNSKNILPYKPTAERLHRISQYRKVFVKRYESLKAAGLLHR